jgi:RES domain
MPKLCSPECFGDRGLRRDIIPSLSPSTGDCSYCGTAGINLIEPVALRDVFELLVSVYEPDPAGKSLVEWLKEDWDLFRHTAMDVAHAKELLGEILDDGDIVQKPFSPSAAYHSAALARWETLRDELMYKNRYFLNEVLDTDRLKELLGHLPADDMPTQWYRARILTGDVAYPIDQMGAPPARLAAHGRANPAGIPYLYLGSLPDTAAAEVRPHTGEVACVAEFTVASPLRAVDLRNPRALVSPFVLANASAIGQLRADITFLERLGDELTRPVLPRSAAIDYIPSQYLCEFIKKAGYDGVVYRSSVSKGINLALFDPTKATGRTVSLYMITKVTVEVGAV